MATYRSQIFRQVTHQTCKRSITLIDVTLSNKCRDVFNVLIHGMTNGPEGRVGKKSDRSSGHSSGCLSHTVPSVGGLILAKCVGRKSHLTNMMNSSFPATASKQFCVFFFLFVYVHFANTDRDNRRSSNKYTTNRKQDRQGAVVPSSHALDERMGIV